MVSWCASFARDRPAPLSVQNCGRSKQLHLACELLCSRWVKTPGFWDSSPLRGPRTQPLVGYQRLAARGVRTGTVVPKPPAVQPPNAHTASVSHASRR